MKRLLVLFLVVIMVCPLAACTVTATTPPSSSESPATHPPQVEAPAEITPREEPTQQPAPAEIEYPQLTGETGIYKAGVYEVTVRGMGGNIVFHITFGPDAITEIEAVKHHETAGLGDRALEYLIPAIIEGQNTQVDSWSGATITSDAIRAAVNTAIEKALV